MCIDQETFQRKRQNSSPYNSEVVIPTPLTNDFLDASSSQQQTPIVDEVKIIDSILPFVSEKDEKQKTTRKYINHDLVDEALKSYQTQVMPGERLMYDNVDILSLVYPKMKKTELAKSTLFIGVVNIHNINCTKFLPLDSNNL